MTPKLSRHYSICQSLRSQLSTTLNAMASSGDFFEKTSKSFPGVVYLDDDDYDKPALIVIDEFPVDVCGCRHNQSNHHTLNLGSDSQQNPSAKR